MHKNSSTNININIVIWWSWKLYDPRNEFYDIGGKISFNSTCEIAQSSQELRSPLKSHLGLRGRISGERIS